MQIAIYFHYGNQFPTFFAKRISWVWSEFIVNRPVELVGWVVPQKVVFPFLHSRDISAATLLPPFCFVTLTPTRR